MSADEQRKLAAIMFTDMVGYSALSNATKSSRWNCWRNIAGCFAKSFRALTGPRSKPSVTLSSLNSTARWKRPNAPLKSSAPWPNATAMCQLIGESN